MRVQRVVMSGAGGESWTLLNDAGVPVDAVEQFLAYLSAIERSPNTVKAYAHDLKDWFTFLGMRSLEWSSVSLEDVAGFVGWLRLPPPARDGRVLALPTSVPHCAESSVNRKLAAVTSFCEFHARRGVELNGLLASMATTGRGGRATRFKPFLHHITRGAGQRRRTIKLPQPHRRPRVLTVAEAQAILDACGHVRDRFLFALLLDTGVRIGEALGLRHEDLDIAQPQVTVMPRSNDNRARAKAGLSRFIPASGELMRLYADYLSDEYGSLDSDYVFVNLWGRPYGQPLTYPAVYDLVLRLRKRSEVPFGPHWFRHTYATWLLPRGAGMESVKQLLGHASITTTIDTYGHLSVEDARATLEQAGWFTGRDPPVIAPAERTAAHWPGLLAKLMASVRPEFRVDLYVPDPSDPVLGRSACLVADCDRSRTEYGLCSGHGRRWLDRGRPELDLFLADPGPMLNGRRELTGCSVEGCRFGTSGRGLCMRHRSAWTSSGHPDPVAWASTVEPMDPTGRTQCRLPFCSLWTHGRNVFCKAHETRWRQQGRPDIEVFITRCLLSGKARIDFGGLAGQLKLELQYAVQCRSDPGNGHAAATRRRTRGERAGQGRPRHAGALPRLACDPAGRPRRQGRRRRRTGRPVPSDPAARLDETLPTTAVFVTGDLPARPPRLSRRLSEHVMAQVEAASNLDRWASPEGRLITIILIRCGL